jgi:hypothetical protein
MKNGVGGWGGAQWSSTSLPWWEPGFDPQHWIKKRLKRQTQCGGMYLRSRYLGGRGRRIESSRAAWAKLLRLCLKNKNNLWKALGVWTIKKKLKGFKNSLPLIPTNLRQILTNFQGMNQSKHIQTHLANSKRENTVHLVIWGWQSIDCQNHTRALKKRKLQINHWWT